MGQELTLAEGVIDKEFPVELEKRCRETVGKPQAQCEVRGIRHAQFTRQSVVHRGITAD